MSKGTKQEANKVVASVKQSSYYPLEYADSDGDVRLRVGEEQSKSYAELLEAWKDCERCPLSASRDKVVFARGTIPADVLFIGEAPGPKEDEAGFPFLGPSGRLLDTIINELRKSRTGWEYAIANPVGCIPWDRADNGKDPFQARSIEENEIEKCNPRFVKIVELAEPRGIVLLGKIAEEFWRRYGADVQKQTKREYKILSTYHPSDLLNGGGAKEANVHYRNMLSGLKQFLFQVIKVGKGD